ncbi:MAG: NAD(P)-dependent oxidoreductase [Armatimonadetes bacterium]|nr:NAD(P)-dependent oxidoreductase [Armatimonadota bacterium]
MARIFLTGATGRLGSNLALRLSRDGHDVVALAQPNDRLRGRLDEMERVEVVEADLRDTAAVRAATQGCEAIIHTAALMNVRTPGISRADFFRVNVVGTFNVFEAATEAGVDRVVYISSTSAYDVYSAKPQPLTEDQPLTPTALYGTTKAINERMAELYAHMADLRAIILRPNYIMACDEPLGPWTAGVVVGQIRTWCRDPRGALYMPDAEEPWREVEQQVQNPGDRVVPQDPAGVVWRWHVTDVRDAVEACVRALEAPESCFGRVYNVAGPEPADWDVVVPYVAEKLGQQWYEVRVPKAWRFWFDITRARQELGFEPQYDIKTMIDDAVRFREGEDIGVLPPGIPH